MDMYNRAAEWSIILNVRSYRAKHALYLLPRALIRLVIGRT